MIGVRIAGWWDQPITAGDLVAKDVNHTRAAYTMARGVRVIFMYCFFFFYFFFYH